MFLWPDSFPQALKVKSSLLLLWYVILIEVLPSSMWIWFILVQEHFSIIFFHYLNRYNINYKKTTCTGCQVVYKAPTITLNPLPIPPPSSTLSLHWYRPYRQSRPYSFPPPPFLPPHCPYPFPPYRLPRPWITTCISNISLLCYTIIVVRKWLHILVKRLRKWYDFNDFKLFFRYIRKIW